MNDTVRLFIRQHPNRDILTPSKGFARSVTQSQISEWPRKIGEKRGDHWNLGVANPADKLRLLRFDSGQWKSRLASMLTRAMGERGGVTFFGDRPSHHELLALHLSSEYPVLVESRGQKVHEWKRYADRENHLLDALVGASLAASMEGLSPLTAMGASPASPPKKNRISFADLQRSQSRRRNPVW
jgi:hypothetical protein